MCARKCPAVRPSGLAAAHGGGHFRYGRRHKEEERKRRKERNLPYGRKRKAFAPSLPYRRRSPDGGGYGFRRWRCMRRGAVFPAFGVRPEAGGLRAACGRRGEAMRRGARCGRTAAGLGAKERVAGAYGAGLRVFTPSAGAYGREAGGRALAAPGGGGARALDRRALARKGQDAGQPDGCPPHCGRRDGGVGKAFRPQA